MTKPKKQHYVPQFLLRRFAVEPHENPRLWVLDKRTCNVYASSVRDVGHENAFYEYSDQGGNYIALESLMARIDTIGARIIDGILQKKTITHLSAEDVVWFSCVVACQMVRTPMVRSEMDNMRDLIISKWGPQIHAVDDPRPIGKHGPADSKISSLQMIQHDVPAFGRLLQAKVRYLCQPPPGHRFIISDSPVIRYNMIDRFPRGNLGLKNRGIQVSMPLSPHMAVEFICPRLALAAALTPALSQQFSAAVHGGKPLQQNPENVDFANSQQVIWAERFVYGGKREDLDLALDMLRTNPELKEGPGVRQRPDEA